MKLQLKLLLSTFIFCLCSICFLNTVLANNFEKRIHSLDHKWINYYKNKVEGFDLKKFKLVKSEKRNSLIQGSILGDFDEKFMEDFSEYLIESPDKTHYIDIDTYWLFLEKDENGNLTCTGMEIDQEVNWVNRKTQEIKRISFTGPGSIVHDAMWESDSTIILFGITEDELFIEFINLATLEFNLFVYPDTVKYDESYITNVRLKNIKFE